MQPAVLSAAAVLLSTTVAVRVYHYQKPFHTALFEAVFAVSSIMTAAAFLTYEFGRLF